MCLEWSCRPVLPPVLDLLRTFLNSNDDKRVRLRLWKDSGSFGKQSLWVLSCKGFLENQSP